MKNKPHMKLAEQIQEREVLPGLKLFVMKTATKRVVTMRGSLIGGDFFPPQRNKTAADVMVEMLDQGTEKYDKKTLHELLDAHGISIDFSTSRFQLNFSVQCLSEDIDLAIELLSQMLRFPTFPESELDVVCKRLIGDIKERATDTRSRAAETLTRTLFSEENPNYSLSCDEEINYLEKIVRADLTTFHKLLGLGNMFLVAVGDVNAKKLNALVAKYFDGWRHSNLVIPTIQPTKAPSSKTVTTNIQDKTSVDVLIGTTIPFGDKHPDFYPLLMANMVFGATPTSRLMKEVREKKGLTYGTYSYLTGTGNNTPGYFAAWGTFAPELLKEGVSALSFEMNRFITKGITENELAEKKRTVTGSYKVSLSTTRGLASIILSNVEHGRAKEFIDEYPSVIEKLTLAQVNGAIKKYLSSKNLVTSIAGSVE